MKRLFFILAIACMATVGMNAQRYNRASFGIIGGLTSSKSHVKDVDASSLSLYHVGITAQLPLFSGLAIQPSLLYQVKGTSVDNIDDAQWKDFQTKVGYLELPVQIQWGPDLGFLRPYAFAEPFVGYRLGSSNDGQAKTIKSELKKAEYGLGVGAGLDFWKLQFSIKYFWNFGNIYGSGNIADTVGDKVRDAVNNGNNFNGVAFSLALFF
ncbi:MAG: PorT family protein [Bacteroidales bacterium]|jgi:hypothetical protein|nr:PorT family protein [Bacteroidales bacterium]MCI2133312.1 PorT family protein [Bacteroidales bacterium]